MRQIANMSPNSVTHCNQQTWPCALFSTKELTTPASAKSAPSWGFTSLLTWTFREFWCGPIDLCDFIPSAGSAEWLSTVVILKGSVSKGCAGGFGAGSPSPASTQLVPNQKQYTWQWIWLLCSWNRDWPPSKVSCSPKGDLLFCCESWGLVTFPTDTRIVGIHYFSYIMSPGSVCLCVWAQANVNNSFSTK